MIFAAVVSEVGARGEVGWTARVAVVVAAVAPVVMDEVGPVAKATVARDGVGDREGVVGGLVAVVAAVGTLRAGNQRSLVSKSPRPVGR